MSINSAPAIGAPPQIMKAAVLLAPRRFEVQTIPLPEPAPSQVRVRLEGSGVSRANLSAWTGTMNVKYPAPPGAPGSEGWGIVDAVGADVINVTSGDRVGFLSHGSFAEYNVVPADAVVQIPPTLNGIPFPGESLAKVMNVGQRCGFHEAQSVAIIGLGFLGSMLASIAQQAGARVIVVSRRQSSLDIVTEYGIRETILHKSNGPVRDRIDALTNGQWCDRVVETIGDQDSLDLASEITRESGRLVIAGHHEGGCRSVNMDVWGRRGFVVINPLEWKQQALLKGMHDAIVAMCTKQLNPKRLFTHTFPLEQLSQAFRHVEERTEGYMKSLIRF